jgi:succinate dehydrogenase subunit C
MDSPQSQVKEYRRPMKPTWFLRNRYLVLFMIREITSLFVAAYCFFLLAMLFRASQGPEMFTRFYESLKRPEALAFHLVTLLFVVFHSITWFNLTPKAVIIWRGEEKVPPHVIQGAHYGLWAVMSLVVIGLLWLA